MSKKWLVLVLVVILVVIAFWPSQIALPPCVVELGQNNRLVIAAGKTVFGQKYFTDNGTWWSADYTCDVHGMFSYTTNEKPVEDPDWGSVKVLEAWDNYEMLVVSQKTPTLNYFSADRVLKLDIDDIHITFKMIDNQFQFYTSKTVVMQCVIGGVKELKQDTWYDIPKGEVHINCAFPGVVVSLYRP